MKLGAVLLGIFGMASVAACSSSDGGTTTPAPGVGADGGAPQCSADLAPPENRAVPAGCTVTISSPGLQEPASKHVPVGTEVTYCTNPPSSGPHYAIWAEFREYTQEVDVRFLLHSEEHGGVLLLYNCPEGCPDVLEALRGVRTRAPIDPTCEAQGRPGTKRIIIAPSTTIPTKIAAAAWAHTYNADCLDPASLDEFVQKHGQSGPENICYAGQVFP